MPRAPYACDPAHSRGRLHPQAPSATRDAYARDRDRIVHSTAFRRLNGKTQVFVAAHGDHYRVRLTHTLEVAQIARTLARALDLDEALTEAIALAHDLGHPPFGHAGEAALDTALRQAGGWFHNAHTLRVVTRLETPYPGFDGLNLTWETLDGLAKHNGPVGDAPWALREAEAAWALDLTTQPSLEAQVAALADDIAYDCHDLDDGFRAGLFTLDEALAVPFLAECWASARARHPAAEDARLWPELIREAIGRFTADMLCETRTRISAAAPASTDAVRAAAGPLAAFSPEVAYAERLVKRFLYARMYQAKRVADVTAAAAGLLRALFDVLASDPDQLPRDWRAQLPAANPGRFRSIADYVAGMTDRFAIREHTRLIGPPELPAALF